MDEGFCEKVDSQVSDTLHALQVLKNLKDEESRRDDLEKLNASRERLIETIRSSDSLQNEIVRIVNLPIPTKTCSVPVEDAIKTFEEFRQQLSTVQEVLNESTMGDDRHPYPWTTQQIDLAEQSLKNAYGELERIHDDLKG